MHRRSTPTWFSYPEGLAFPWEQLDLLLTSKGLLSTPLRDYLRYPSFGLASLNFLGNPLGEYLRYPWEQLVCIEDLPLRGKKKMHSIEYLWLAKLPSGPFRFYATLKPSGIDLLCKTFASTCILFPVPYGLNSLPPGLLVPPLAWCIEDLPLWGKKPSVYMHQRYKTNSCHY